MGNNVYFAADDITAPAGVELWKTNGTVSGTKMLKDIYPGTGSSYVHGLYAFNGRLYFGAFNGKQDELWKSDGTAVGTKVLKAMFVSSFQASGNTLYIAGNTPAHGSELWKTDGSTTGTKLIKDIAAGIAWSNPFNLTDVNGTLFFTADNGINGNELWMSRGSSTNTKLVKDITPGGSSSFRGFTVAASELFFQYYDSTESKHTLWTSDGTDTGTYEVSNEFDYIIETKGNDNNLFLSGSTYAYGDELFEKDASVITALQNTSAVANIIAVNTLSAQLAANPFTYRLNIRVSSLVKQKVNIVITNTLGNVYYNSVMNIQANSTCSINTNEWPRGMYLIMITDMHGKNTIVLKAVK
jgi:ELWxxDGT repeat protein